MKKSKSLYIFMISIILILSPSVGFGAGQNERDIAEKHIPPDIGNRAYKEKSLKTALNNTHKRMLSLAWDPFSFLWSGAIEASLELFVTYNVSLGLHFSKRQGADDNFGNDDTLEVFHPYARYYLSPTKHSWYAGAGFIRATYESTEINKHYSSSKNGMSLGVGYSWLWEDFSMDLGYEFWALSDFVRKDEVGNESRVKFYNGFPVFRIGIIIF